MVSWEPIHNPYIVGNPIKGAKLFFGREDDFAFIKSKFAGGKEGGLIVLCGARRSGKTSILFQILDGRLGDEFLPILIDLQSMAIVSERQMVRRVLELIGTAAAAAGFPVEHVDMSDNPFDDLEDFAARLTRAMGKRKLLLAFDEYEIFETGIDSKTISGQVLRTLANLIEHRNVFVLFTGSEKLEERSKKYWDIFLSKALHRRISFLSHDDALRLIREPVEGVLEYAAGVPERIYDLTAGQPFYTQVICQSIVDHLNDERKRRVEIEDVERAVEEVIQNPLPQMIFHWSALADLQKLTLAIIGELTRRERRAISAAQILEFVRKEKLGLEIDPGALNKALDKLFHGDLVHRDPKTDTYEFKMDLWRLWAIRMHSVWQVIGEIDQAGGPESGSGISRSSPKRSGRRPWAIGLAVAAVAVGAYVATNSIRNPKEVMTQREAVTAAPAATDGFVLIKSDPPGANIFIDGEPVGRSPILRRMAPTAAALLRAELDGYRVAEEHAGIATGDTTKVNLVLVEQTGGVTVETQPPGGRAVLDGGRAKVTPATWKTVSAGRTHRLTISLDGYTPTTYDVNAVADSTIKIVHAFSRLTSPLAISSTPPGASVTIDGNIVGSTPYATAGVAHGSHDIALDLAGYKVWFARVDVPVKNNLVDVPLIVLEPGTLVFSISPYGDIFVDGKRVAQAVPYYKLDINAGSHSVEIRNPMFQTFAKGIELEPGGTLRVEHTFTESR